MEMGLIDQQEMGVDHFGIGNAIKGVIEIYFRACRRTGRTTSLVESAKDGDRVVFVNRLHASEFERLCRERGIAVETFICDPGAPERLFERPSVAKDGRLIFDHAWIEEYYRLAIEGACNHLDRMQREIGGYGAAHAETARAARQAHRDDWRLT